MSDLSLLPIHSLCELLQNVTVPASSPHATVANWAKTFVCRPRAVFAPCTIYQCALILELARREGKTVRAVGVGHSPSDLACTDEYMLRTTKLDKILVVSLLFRLSPLNHFPSLVPLSLFLLAFVQQHHASLSDG